MEYEPESVTTVNKVPINIKDVKIKTKQIALFLFTHKCNRPYGASRGKF